MLDGQPTVLSLFPQTPAQRSPVRPGDKIKRISNNPTEGMSLEDIYEALDGERETKVGLKKESFKTFGNSFPDFPIAVLINDRTASAAELFAAVIRDRKVGVLVERNSRGKSVVQHYIQLSNDFWLKLTTSQSLTPSEYKIPNNGLKPDLESPQYVKDKEIALRWLQKQ